MPIEALEIILISVRSARKMGNRKCSCGREIKAEDTYFIKIDSDEMPEIFCEFCISETI